MLLLFEHSALLFRWLPAAKATWSQPALMRRQQLNYLQIRVSQMEESAGAVFTWGCGQNGRLGYEARPSTAPESL